MRDPYRRYQSMSYRDIRSRLTAEGLTSDAVELTVLNIRELREARSRHLKHVREMNKQWGEVIEALQHERRIVRGMVRYKTKVPAPEREEFVQDYFAVLNKLYDRLNERRLIGKTLPEHSHWVDFVPERIREAFIRAAEDVPPRDRAKFKAPFQRTAPIVLAERRRNRLLRYTRSTLDTVLAGLEENGDDPKLARKEWLLRKAVERINAMPVNAHIPNHWADTVRDLMEADDDTAMSKKPRVPKTTKRGAPVRGPAILGKTQLELANRQNEVYAKTERTALGSTIQKLLGVQNNETE